MGEHPCGCSHQEWLGERDEDRWMNCARCGAADVVAIPDFHIPEHFRAAVRGGYTQRQLHRESIDRAKETGRDMQKVR